MSTILSRGATASSVTTRIVNYVGGKETFVSTAYLDPAGVWTIGYGFTMRSGVFAGWWKSRHGRALGRGDTMTIAEAHQVLLAILTQECARRVDTTLANCAQRIREAANSMVYNCGAGALGWKWAKALVAGDLHGACALWRRTGTTAKGRRLPGLVIRRGEEADIAELDRWPAWVSDAATPPAGNVHPVDLKQAQIWLNALGYDCGPADGLPGQRTTAAVRRFQADHGNLKVDGIVGAATLSALQRAIDLKSAATRTAGGTVVVAGGGAGAEASGSVPHDWGWLGDLLLWGGLLVGLGVLGWLAWRYRDELQTALRKL